MSDSEDIHEIVIIKRVQGGHGDEHHGGVWKIAFADFMTAMMAFFLVMWLISVSDKTKAVIARYFNPVQLVDSTPQKPGLNDPNGATTPTKASKSAGEEKGAPNASKDGHNADPTPAVKTADAEQNGKRDESNLFKDPYAVLAELAAKNTPQTKTEPPKAPTDGKLGGSGAVGMKGGLAYRDPFEPIPLPPGSPDPDGASVSVDAQKLAARAPAGNLESEPSPAREDAEVAERTVAAAPTAPIAPAAPVAPATPASARAAAREAAREADELRAKVAAAVQPFQAAGAGKGPSVSVKQTGEGTLIDITDGTSFAMFASASAEPAPKLVALMDKIGKLLKSEKGRVIVRGYTDSRPFRSDTYDNWRLSAARAHMAHYMLVRGGVEESRFEAIEGYADRNPKNPQNPESPENRRIEILIRTGMP